MKLVLTCTGWELICSTKNYVLFVQNKQLRNSHGSGAARPDAQGPRCRRSRWPPWWPASPAAAAPLPAAAAGSAPGAGQPPRTRRPAPSCPTTSRHSPTTSYE